MMPPRAKQIVDRLSEMFPQIDFEWKNDVWPLMDATPCTLIAYQKSNPEDKVSLNFSSGISEHTVEEQIDGIANHLLPKLKQ